MKIKIISFLLLAALLLAGCASTTDDLPKAGEIVHITKENYDAEVTKSEKIILLDFYADWCGPCQKMAPILQEIADERSDIKICKVNVDEQPELSAMFGIEAMPTLVVMKNGKILKTAVGYRAKSQILSLIDG